MGNFRNIYKLIPILLLLVWLSCKKKDATPAPDEVKDVATSELLDYYIVAQHKSGKKLSVIYFTREGSSIKANVHLVATLRFREVNIKNLAFSIDLDDDGKAIYSFTVEKDASGKLRLSTYRYAYQNIGNQLTYAIIAKKTEAFAFAQSSFKIGDKSFNFYSDTGSPLLKWITTNSYTYYNLTNVGFKTNDNQFIGATVPNWDGIDTPVILIEKDNIMHIATKQ